MALAPEQTGIGIRRHFTRADEHPYDAVEWDRRDARITNWADGSVAFEQLGVEFPRDWSVNATNIVAQKYFRGTLGAPERESSLRQVIDRVADTITTWGIEGGYFVDDAEAEAFRAELKHLLVTQKAAFNSPVWFNIGVPDVPQQASACFILAVDDAMDSILNWYREEGVIFKGGSGSGVNLSKIRSSVEHLKGGGTASGPVSFMRGADASAGTIKSGGKTRRAAKMVILDVSHPDVEEFIWVKAREEKKIRVLEDAGFDMTLDGKDMASVQYQNANNSVRVTDEFMQAVVDDADWHLRTVTTGEVVRTVKARDLMRQFAQATWECADPGMQYDTTINRWHTAANTDRINGSNPCFPGDSMVHTDKGLVAFADLVDRARLGESFGIYTHDATSSDAPAERLELTSPDAVMITGLNEIVRLRFSNGSELRCTPNHRIWTTNRGWVRADELSEDDDVKQLDLPAPATAAEWRLPVSTDVEIDAEGRDRRALAGVVLPEKWSEELAHYLGWLVGDGCISGDVASTVYGSAEEQTEILPRHQALLAELNGGRVPTPSIQANGTAQLRISRSVLVRFLEALGVTDAKAPEKRIPWSINEAPPEIAAAFLRGLYDADGCVYDGATNRYVGLGSASAELVRDVQRLLTTFGIRARSYRIRSGREDAFTHVRKDGTLAIYETSDHFDLRVSAGSIATFAKSVGFDHPAKASKLEALLDEHHFNRPWGKVRLIERIDDTIEQTYNLSEPRNHSYVVDGTVVSNCSEYMHIDNSACNLASVNLLEFLHDGAFDVDGFKQACSVMFTGQEILVGRADYPTDPIGENSRKFRQLGLGYANLGALLMATGAPYDSAQGRAWAAAITSLMTGHAYEVSARTAARMGPFAGYAENSEHMLRVLDMHRTAAADIDEELVPSELLGAAQETWDEACELADQFGVRNSQASVLAPTGCLVGGSMVTTDRGVVRLRSLGDPDGDQWQDLDARVLTDEGEQAATQFYVNGLERVVDVTTHRGYHIAGTTKHRIKVVDESGEWVWRRFADVGPGDTVPLARGGLVGDPQRVALPPLGEGYRWTAEHDVRVPETMTAELAELVGYFMGDGSLHSRGLRLCVAEDDLDVIDHLERLAKSLFGIEARVRPEEGYASVEISSVQLVDWWRASGFAKRIPVEGHTGKGWLPHIPDAVLHANDAEVYGAFLRGLFEADGTVTAGYPSWTTTSLDFSREVQTLMLSLGYVTTRRFDTSGRGSRLAVLRLLNQASAGAWLDDIGFLSGRKAVKVARGEHPQAARYDHIPVTRELIDRVAPEPGRDRNNALQELRRSGTITRALATMLVAGSGDTELTHLLGFFYDRVTEAALGGEELTYDISVPANVTYVANGFVSHNTIGLMMDCDTTGIEPDLGLVKTKKLVGGGTMSIVNQTVPRALRNLGYDETDIAEIVAYVDEHKTIVGAPGLNPDHLEVFACSMGDNTIHYLGHVKMMAAVQPFISGAISKCVTGETLLPTADGLVRIGSLRRDEAPDSFRDEIMEVASLGDTQKTDAFYYGGLRDTLGVTLRSGHRVTATPNHRLLVARDGALDWVRVDELTVGDAVATKYGSELWSAAPPRLDDFVPSAPYGCQKRISVPDDMTPELGFLLGALASEGHITRSNWTVHMTNSAPGVRDRVANAWRSLFGLEACVIDDGVRCPSVAVASKTVVELLDHLGVGGRASEKRIPDAVLRSPREVVLAFLQGLALDAYVTSGPMAKWAICLDSPALLDDLQAILTNLGVVHGRISKHNATYDKDYDEVYAAGVHAQHLLHLVPFLEPDKAAAAGRLGERVILDRHSTADLVPGITPRKLYELLPRGRSGRGGHGVRGEFAYLCDPRTRSVTRRSVERVAAIEGVTLPEWLRTVLDDDLHFSPVASVEATGPQEVFDVSVPANRAFVGNGIVNHNTVNMPTEATVEDVEQLHVDAWRMGVKAIAVYRDGCKVSQPLSMTKKDGAEDAPGAGEVVERVVEKVVEKVITVKEPVRKKLPRSRASRTFEFRVADCKGFVSVGQYDDGRPGEIFIRISKQGSTLAGIMDAFAVSISYGLQYGVPLRAYVETFTNTRFEPAGMTDDPDIRIASSLVDYMFRRLAVEYLSYEERAELGILTVSERTQPTLPGVEETVTETVQGTDAYADPKSVPSASDLARELADDGTNQPSLLERAGVLDAETDPAPDVPQVRAQPRTSDAPYCMQCGVQMVRAGSCHACPSCGSTSGCS